MTPERMAALVHRWVRFYTRDLPAPTARRRIDELAADLHDHIAHERVHGTSERRIALSIASRMVRGLPADASWRGRTIARTSTPGNVMKTAYRSALRVGIPTALILLVPLVWMQFSDGMDWGVFDFVFAAIVLGGTGLLIERTLSNPGSLVLRVLGVAIGLAAMVVGELDDAPGLVLFGLLLILATIALAVRTARSA